MKSRSTLILVLVLFFGMYFEMSAKASVVGLPKTGQTKCYNSSGYGIAGNEINCQGTGQDGEKQTGVAWPSPRFSSREISMVKDSLTGLVWTKDANAPGPSICNAGTQMTWTAGMNYIACLNSNNYLGFNDWRMPNINELRSLLNYNISNSTDWLSNQGFINIGTSYYISSTSLSANGSQAWTIRMYDVYDRTVAYMPKDSTGWRYYIWPVRSDSEEVANVPSEVLKTGQKNIYYVSDDGNLQYGASLPIPRFTDNFDGTVTDNLTGLEWIKSLDLTGPYPCSSNSWMMWPVAMNNVDCLNGKNYLGHNDWRAPNINELSSLLDYSRNNPTLSLSHPFVKGDGNYLSLFLWSATTNAKRTSDASIIDLGMGTVKSIDKSETAKMLLVRTVIQINSKPTANAGSDQSVHVGNIVTLDGSASSDPDNNYPLTYTWTFVLKPDGSQAILTNGNASQATFKPDVIGSYVLELVVTDNKGATSVADQVVVSTSNSVPVADAGPAQAVTVIGSTVNLDGSRSFDNDGDQLTYSWSINVKPDGSQAALSDPNSTYSSFVADVHGEYIVGLTVSDPWTTSNIATVTISFLNVVPVANAGGNQSTIVGTQVYLNGCASSDANGDMLSFSWNAVSMPVGSSSVLTDILSCQTSFNPDLPGQYIMGLTVNDGYADSTQDNATIMVISKVDAATQEMQNIIPAVNSIPLASFKNGKMQNALTNKINSVLANIEAGLYADALNQLENDVLGKTDGCANAGAPDNNDWITDCSGQGAVYPLIVEAINMLRSL